MQKNLKMKLRILIASLFMVAITPNMAEAAFTATCRNIRLAGGYRSTVMEATCQDEQGNWIATSIRLGNYIGRNPRGRLVWRRRGNFRQYCRRYDLIPPDAIIENRTRLEARCTIPNSNGHMMSTLNLDERIVNRNGNLIYVAP